jgi:hypothetical protein
MKRQKCKKCNQGYKTLTEDNLCYYCFVKKHGSVPKTGLYARGKEDGK